MQEKVVLEVFLGKAVGDELDDATFENYRRKVFLDAHREEISAIISVLPSTSNDSTKFECIYERFITILDTYQEQPALLDCCLNDMVRDLLSCIDFLEKGQTRFNEVSSAAFKLLSHLSKVRGYKPFMSFLPHEIWYLEKVLSSLELCTNDFHASYILLLWMVILCRNPFDLNRFDPKADDPLFMDRRIIDIALSFFSRPVDKRHPVAALLITVVACRAETCSTLLPSLIKDSAERLKNCKEKFSTNVDLIGHLYLLVAVFKQGQRKDLLPYASMVLESLGFLRQFDGCDFLVKKLVTKLVQRLGMVFLKPKVATWRYNRGNRVLSFNSAVGEGRTEADVIGPNIDTDYNIPQHELENVLDTILKSLRDCDTAIRWSAAKGIGRVTSRLPKNLAEDVVRSILANVFDELSGHAAWHGGCLAIAELARRGYLTVELLPDVMKVVEKALMYEEPQGRHALGANVRDAACYIAWALARAFRPSDMAKFMDKLAASLVCVALFDREINVRRAASAAFQENVGRQGTLPNGIEILTKIDFFAVGQRSRTYVETACEVAKYPHYAWPIVEHLLYNKIIHWDENLRYLAAESLRRLALTCGNLIKEQIPLAILPLLSHAFPVQKQGGILALCGSLSGLKACVVLEDSLLERAARVPLDSYAVCEKKSRITGGLLIRNSINIFIQLLSSVIPLRLIPVDGWIKSLELNIVDENEDLRRNAGNAAASFFSLFEEPDAEHLLVLHVKDVYIPKLIYADVECHCQGLALLFSALPVNVLLKKTNGVSLFEEIIAALNAVLKRRNGVYAVWAFGRQSCIQAMADIVMKIGVNKITDIARIIDCIINALNDYTISRQGDVGRFLRECAMKCLALILPKLWNSEFQKAKIDEAVCKIVQQSCEKIDAIRVCAADVMCDLLCCGVEHIVEKETLRQVYLNEVPPGFIGDPKLYKYNDWRLKSCFSRLALLIKSPHYALCSLNGFVISAGGLTESTRRSAVEAVFEVVAQYRDSLQFMEGFLHNLSLVITQHANERRVITPFLCFMDQVFSAQLLTLFENDPDSSPSFIKIVNFVTCVASAGGHSQTVRLAVNVLCHLLHFSNSSYVWQKAVSVVVRTLSCPYPHLRRNAAEQLYESLAAEFVMEDETERRDKLLDLLANTEWQMEDKESIFLEISNSISRLLNVL